ncbi:MAG: hypothetical protein NTY74_15815 [Ignavibacteriae bacterium]|nr:hypothetical protein [Ignavibacteriota bacterium]
MTKQHFKVAMKSIAMLTLLLSFITCSNIFAQEKAPRSFGEQGKNKKYTSFALGMGAAYGNNKSLNTFIGYELPNYNTLTASQQLKDFRTAFEFFGNAERQVSKNLALKLDYSYLIKSNKVTMYPSNTFDYNNHQIVLILNYVVPGDYHFLKFGAGAGPVFSSLESVSYITNSGTFTSTGVLAKAETSFSIQMGKSLAGYINGYIGNVFAGNLKGSDGKELKNAAGESVNLSSFMIGLRLGIEFYIF